MCSNEPQSLVAGPVPGGEGVVRRALRASPAGHDAFRNETRRPLFADCPEGSAR
jgi:hypothetical protein